MMWMKKAACKGLPIDLFMPKRGEIMKVREARAICKECPVVGQCRAYGLETAQVVDLDGIFGGWTKLERLRFLRENGLHARRTGGVMMPNPNMRRVVVKQHGTETAYRKHLASKEKPCDICFQAHEDRKYRAAQYNRTKK